MGFEEDEALLPYPKRSFDGYRLLQEYFTFSEKFLFFELKLLEAIAAAGCGAQAEILFAFHGSNGRSAARTLSRESQRAPCAWDARRW